MELNQVRAQINGTWYTLTYNPATGRYEAKFTAPETSFHQPGGYYNVEADASLDTGETTSVSGTQLPSLRFVVNETAAPSLTLVSPSPGYLTTGTPVLVFEAVDEEGGSGVDPDTFSLTGAAAEEIPGGYRFTWSPPGGWADGAHTVTASVQDHDGNQAAVSAAYTVDTAPPEIALTLPDSHRVVDSAVIPVAGSAWDATSGLAAVDVDANGSQVPVLLSGGTFSALAALDVGVNNITITAADAAGNEASITFQVLRLVTDRAQADADRVLDMCRRGYANWTEAERAWWANTPSRRGSYDAQDVNRVETAMDWIARWLAEYGYACGYAPGGPWAEEDNMVRPDGAAYLLNVEAVRAAIPALPEDAPTTPGSFSELAGPQGVQRANDIEAILVAADAVRPKIDVSPWTSGEIYCGEF